MGSCDVKRPGQSRGALGVPCHPLSSPPLRLKGKSASCLKPKPVRPKFLTSVPSPPRYLKALCAPTHKGCVLDQVCLFRLVKAVRRVNCLWMTSTKDSRRGHHSHVGTLSESFKSVSQCFLSRDLGKPALPPRHFKGFTLPPPQVSCSAGFLLSKS